MRTAVGVAQAPYWAKRSSVSTRLNSSCWAIIDFWISKCFNRNRSWNSRWAAVMTIGSWATMPGKVTTGSPSMTEWTGKVWTAEMGTTVAGWWNVNEAPGDGVAVGECDAIVRWWRALMPLEILGCKNLPVSRRRKF